MDFSMTETRPLRLVGKDRLGNTVALPAGSTATWSSSDLTVAAVTPAIDTLSAAVTPLQTGVTTISGTLVANGNQYPFSVDLNITAGPIASVDVQL